MNSQEINEFIEQNAELLSDSKLAEHLGITPKAVRERRRRLDIHKSHNSGKGGEATPEETIEDETHKDRVISRQQAKIDHLSKLYREQTRRSADLEALEGAIREVTPSYKPVKAPTVSKPSRGASTESVVLLLSDFHFGEVVDPEQTANMSAYNLDIGQRRLEHTVDSVIRICKEKLAGGYNLPRLYIFMLGDLVSGVIHNEFLQNDEAAIVEQCLRSTDIIAPEILKLCQVFEKVRVTSVVGNHGRVTKEKYFKGKATNNYDYLVSKFLERLLKNQSNLTFNVPHSFFAVEKVENTSFLIHHGDEVNSWMGIPFYGLDRAYKQWRSLMEDYGQGFRHMAVGHFHTPNILSVVRNKLIINGSLKGGDEFSIGKMRAASDPVQIMFGVHPKRDITWWYEVNSAEIR